VPWQRSISAARASLGSSRASSADGIDGSKLRTMLVESATKLGGLEFAARQSHSLENPLMPECRFLIGLFRGAGVLDCVFLVGSVLSLRHRECTCDGESQTCHNYWADTF
jgi:hypothetical protein